MFALKENGEISANSNMYVRGYKIVFSSPPDAITIFGYMDVHVPYMR